MDKSILIEFVNESKQILSELETVVEKMESEDPASGKESLVQFSQRIDRIMGAAQTLAGMFPENPGFKEIGKIASLCKAMGYRAAQTHSPELLPLFCAFWADTIDVLKDLIDHLEDIQKVNKIVGDFIPVVRKRLEWLSTKIHIVVPSENSSQANATELNELLNALFK